MTTKHSCRTAAVLAVGWLVGWSAVSAQASEIADEAKFFSPDAVAKATEDLNRLEKRSHVEVRIETYAGMSADQKVAYERLTTKTERDKFFADWLRDRARAVHAKGLFVLICRNPSHLYLDVTAAFNHTCGTTLMRNMKCWGGNVSGQLGDGTRTDALFPIQTDGAEMYGTHSTGSNLTCGVTNAGVMRCWGACTRLALR